MDYREGEDPNDKRPARLPDGVVMPLEADALVEGHGHGALTFTDPPAELTGLRGFLVATATADYWATWRAHVGREG